MNTIIFAVVTLAACTVILFAILTPATSEYFVFLTTVGILLTLIVLSTLSTLINFETTDKKPSSSNVASVRVCPDYYGYSTDSSGNITCSRTNILHNSITDSYVQYKLIDCVDGGSSGVIDTIKLDEVLKNVSDKEICNLVSGGNVKFSSAKYTPWTRVRPYCDVKK
jgi:hypothetical protein